MSLFKFFQNVVTPATRVVEGAGQVAEARIGKALEAETQRQIDRGVASVVASINRSGESGSSGSSGDRPPRLRWFGSPAGDDVDE